MEKLKSVLVYVLGLAGLVAVTIFFTGQIESDFQPLPTATPAVRPTATAAPTAAAQTGCQPTPGSTRAYGYVPDTPIATTLAPPDLPGQRLIITGTVYAVDCVTPLPETIVEVWQADANGRYDRSEPYILRGQLQTDATGQYEFTTVKPGHYETSEIARPAHIHFRITYKENDPLITRLMFADDPYWGGGTLTQSPLVTTLTAISETDSIVLHGSFDIILSVQPPAPTPEVSIDKDL